MLHTGYAPHLLLISIYTHVLLTRYYTSLDYRGLIIQAVCFPKTPPQYSLLILRFIP